MWILKTSTYLIFWETKARPSQQNDCSNWSRLALLPCEFANSSKWFVPARLKYAEMSCIISVAWIVIVCWLGCQFLSPYSSELRCFYTLSDRCSTYVVAHLLTSCRMLQMLVMCHMLYTFYTTYHICIYSIKLYRLKHCIRSRCVPWNWDK